MKSQILRLLSIGAAMLFCAAVYGQSPEAEQQRIEAQLEKLNQERKALNRQLEDVKLRKIQKDLAEIGLPSANYIQHSAMALEYDEAREQARWVAHIILPDIIKGVVFRTNDFRPDSMVATGSAVEADYFLKTMKPDSTWAYDGFGYDRGHLAPSADFRWSEKALSESYYYSNMSPQLAAFNRGRWSELEDALRSYVYNHPGTQLYVVTGPLLEKDLPVIERSVNKVAIPRFYFKVALDLENGRSIGFVLPNAEQTEPIAHYAVTVDAVESLTGLDFFNKLEDTKEAAIEGALDKSAWLPESAQGDVEPLSQPDLPRNHFNTTVAARYMGNGETISVCGTVVGSRYSRTGNLWLNLDKQFPNQVFSIYIKKADLVNFSFDPGADLEGQQVCFEGKVENFNNVPTMNVTREEQISQGKP